MKFNKMKTKLLKLAKMLLNFKMIESDKGTLIIDSELTIGAEISIEGENGEVLPAPDGEYIIENQKIEIRDGKIESIETIEPEQPEETETETEEKLEEVPATEEPSNEPDEKDLRIAELEGLLKDRDAIIEELTAKLKELEEKLNKPVEEPVKMAATVKEKTTKANGALKYFEK
jgi:hypothetical protein